MKIRLLAAALILGVGLGGTANSETLDITVGAGPADNHAPVFVAVEKGFFADAGLNAKVILYPTGVEEVNGQVNGAQQVSVLGTAPFLSGISNGLPLVLIAQLSGDPLKDSYSANQSLVAAPGAGIAEGHLEALKGKRIALPFGTDAQTYVVNLLAQAGLKPSDVRLSNGQPAQLATALSSGDADAISIWEPWSSAAVLNVKGAVKVIEGGCNDCFMPATVLTSRKVIDQDKEALGRFMVAFARAAQWVRQHPDEAAEIDMHWIQGASLDVLKASLRHSVFDPRLSKAVEEGFVRKTIPQLVAAHALRRAVDPSKSIDPEFILETEQKDPQFFSDLPPIPDQLRLRMAAGG